VPEAEAARADAWLRAAGWRSTNPAFQAHAHIPVQHSTEYAAQGQKLDLHWHVLADCLYSGADAPFWEAAIPLDLAGTAALALCPTDQLIHVCAHGLRWNPTPPVRWAADAMQVLLSAGSQVDWARLARLAERLRLSLPMSEALGYLRTELEAPIPAEVLTALDSIPVTEAERRYHKLKTSRPGWLGGLPLAWHLYHQAAQQSGTRPHPLGYVRHLQYAFRLRSVWEIPGHAARRLWQKQRAPSRHGPPGERAQR